MFSGKDLARQPLFLAQVRGARLAVFPFSFLFDRIVY
jgi:hypothetical protein